MRSIHLISGFRTSSYLAAVFSVAVLATSALLAQQPAMANDSLAEAQQAGNPSGIELSANAIFALLDTHPELVIDLKTVMADHLRGQNNQGPEIREDAITDDMLFGRINSDAEVRQAISIWLLSRGYVPRTAKPAAAKGDSSENGDEQDRIDPRANTMRSSSTELRSQNALAGANSNGLATPDLSQLPRVPSDRPQPVDHPNDRKQEKIATNASDPNQPVEDGFLHQPTPLNLLALRDLYTQVPEQTSSLRRFGSDVFLHRGLGSPELPIDLPVGPDYVLGPGDTLTIDMWGGISQSLPRIVSHDGRVVLPEAGPVYVAGMTLDEAQSVIQKALGSQFRNARVAVSLARLRTVRVYVVGDVQRPGAYDVSSLSTPLNALYAAGGPTAAGSLRIVRHLRADRVVRELDLYEFLLHGLREDTERLLPGDTILVPPAGTQVSVAGMVRRPAIYELKDEKTVEDTIALAGGLLVAASTTQIKIDRIKPHDNRVTESIDLDRGLGPEELSKSLQSFKVSDGDKIIVAPVLPYSERAIYLEGHVLRPGRYAYRDNMSLVDVLRSYHDLLPEPADHAEIIRLRPPDYRPETISFSLSELMIGNSPILLQPFDTVRVLGRYEADPPKVTIQGEVLRPGPYPLPEKMTAAQLVRMSGGFKRDALLENADLTSYDVKDGNKVVSRRTSIDIGRAVLNNDAAADVVLKPGDVLTIHQISGWNDIGASITIGGEVTYPGTYGIQEGERLSSVLRRAGGFRSTAYPEGALLVRNQVRELEEKSRAELIRQIEATSAAARFTPSLAGEDQGTLQLLVQQQEQVLQRLKTQPSTGRLVIRIGSQVSDWENSAADIELRAGDVLTIPKRPGFILITGQVYNSAAITYAPGKNAEWYLKHSGGPTQMANKHDIFIIRANGSVVGRGSSDGWLSEGVLETKMHPGDVLVVPQKILGGSVFWRNLLATAQFMSSSAITAKVAGF